MKKPIFNAEKLLSISAVVVGACALTVSVIQTRIFRAQQEAAVWPFVHLEFSTGTNDTDTTGTFTIRAKNKGVGPAIVDKVILKYDGKEYDGSQIKILCEKMMSDYGLGKLDGIDQSSLQGIVISANETIRYFEITDKRAAYYVAKSFARIAQEKRMDIEIHYVNIYGKKWVNKSGSNPIEMIK